MSDELTLEVVPTRTNTSSGTASDEPGLLMPKDYRTSLDPGTYPQITAHVTVDHDSESVDDVQATQFSVVEGEESREVRSLEFANSTLDLAFVFDDTGSMSGEIDGAKAGVTELTDAIARRDIDTRYALVTFKDSADEVEVDQQFTSDAGRLKSAVGELEARGGGPVPEANFDAIERALNLDWRDEASRVIVDITDAPSRYSGDGSGNAEYTFDDVTADLQDDDVTFLAVAPDEESKTDSVKTLTAGVGGLWTDISDLRYASDAAASEKFERVLERISSLLSSTYQLTYDSCAPPGEQVNVNIQLDHPRLGTATDTATLSVPERFELPPTCRGGSRDTSAVTIESDPDRPVSDCVEIDVETSNPEIPPEGARIQARVTLDPGSQSRVAEQQTVLCLDESRSMEEPLGGSDYPKMYHVTAAASGALSSLAETDHVGLVAFENTPAVVSELAPLESVGRDAVVDAIESLEPGGGTDVLSALKLARDELGRFDSGPERARRILLLSDGADRFETSTFADLATEIADEGASVMAGGIGPEYDEDVMLTLARHSHGHAAHLETPEDIEDFVYRTVVEPRKLVAANPTLELDVSPVFGIHNLFCRTPEVSARDIDERAPAIVPLPDLLAGEPQTIVFELFAPPRVAGTSHEAADITLQVDDERVAETTLTIEYTDDPSPEQTEIAVAFEETRIAGELRQGADPGALAEDIETLAPKSDDETVAGLRRQRDAVEDGEAGSRVDAGLPSPEET